MNVGSLLINSAAKFPLKTAIITSENRWTFQAFEQRTIRLANTLLATGLKKGDRVALLFFNGIHFAEVYFATLLAGLVAVPVNFRFVGEEIVYVLNNAQAAALFYGPEFEKTLLEIKTQLDSVRHFVSPGDKASALAVDYETFLSGAESFAPLPEMDENDQCQIMYTSGTTGRPKGAILTHGNVLWNMLNTIIGREDQGDEKAVIVGPLYHTAALNNHFTIQIALGGTSIIVRKFEPESFLQTIESEKATIVSGAPALFNLLLQHPAAHKYDTSSITKCTAGSDTLSVALKERLQNFFPNIQGIYDVYGCTEASPCITILNAKDSMRKHGSVGKPLPFLQARVVDEESRPLAVGEVGELICKGPNVMQGYHRNPEGTRAAIKNGWLYTGDLAKIDEEGFVYIVGRKKEMIVSGGENIYPRELEEVLIRHPAIVDVAVIGVADDNWGETVKAFVVLKKGQAIDEQGVIDFCKKHLASYKKPRAVAFLEDLPRNPSGKALKRLLK
jgi:fatty-acyl-CoA synthase